MKAIDRLYDYLAVKGLRPTSLEAASGLSRGYLSVQRRRSADMGESAMNKITDYCPDLSPEWLLTGRGPMLRRTEQPYAPSPAVFTPGVHAEPSVNTPPITLPQSSDRTSDSDSRTTTPPPGTTTQIFPLRADRPVARQRIPIYDMEATAGLVSLFTDDYAQQTIDQIELSSLPHCDGGLRIVGDSMDPILRPGDIVLYKQIHDIPGSLFWGEIYLVSFELDGDEYVTVKYIRKSERPGNIVLASQNPAHQPMEIELCRIRALAFVKASIRIHAMH